MNVKVEIAVGLEKWYSQKNVNSVVVAEMTQSVLNRYDALRIIQEVEISILLTDDKKISSLNSEFRNTNKSTNVLSFPDLEIAWQDLPKLKIDTDYLYLGDIAFSYETIEKEANSKYISFDAHFKHLLVHSILHLIGYNHITDQDAKIMEALEADILSHYNIKSPYCNIE